MRKKSLAASVPLIPNCNTHLFVACSRAPLSFLGSQHCASPWGTLELPPRHHCKLILGQCYASSGAPTDACAGHLHTLSGAPLDTFWAPLCSLQHTTSRVSVGLHFMPAPGQDGVWGGPRSPAPTHRPRTHFEQRQTFLLVGRDLR